MDFTVIGDVVNLAARIEKLSKHGKHTKIIFSHQIEERVRGLLDYERLDEDRVQGREEAVHAYELIGVRDIRGLVGNLRLDDTGLRRRSVELLGFSRNPESLSWVVGMSRRQRRRHEAAGRALGGRLGRPGAGSREALEALIARFPKERSDKVLSALISAVGRLAGGNRTPRSP